MKTIIEELRALGCEMESTMDRFLGNEEFYIECYQKVLNDSAFTELKKGLDCHDIDASFESAHTLKGLLANLGLTSLYQIVCEMVEVLRTGNDVGLSEKYNLLLAEREKYPQIQEKKERISEKP